MNIFLPLSMACSGSIHKISIHSATCLVSKSIWKYVLLWVFGFLLFFIILHCIITYILGQNSYSHMHPLPVCHCHLAVSATWSLQFKNVVVAAGCWKFKLLIIEVVGKVNKLPLYHEIWKIWLRSRSCRCLFCNVGTNILIICTTSLHILSFLNLFLSLLLSTCWVLTSHPQSDCNCSFWHYYF